MLLRHENNKILYKIISQAEQPVLQYTLSFERWAQFYVNYMWG